MHKKKSLIKKASKKKLHFWNHQIWLIVLLIGIIFAFAGLIASEYNSASEYTTGHATVQVISYAPEGSSLHFEIRNVKGFKEGTIYFGQTIKDGKVVFQEDHNIPFKGIIYNKILVSSEQEEKITKLTLLLKIKESDLYALGLNPYELRLYVDGQEKETTYTELTDGYAYYTVSTNKLGKFVLGKRKIEPLIGGVVEQPVIEIVPEEQVVDIKEAQEQFPSPIQEPASKIPVAEGFWTKFLTKIKQFFGLG
ncbi:hypothetical protein HYX12_02320 [Candidatus Woesearchaeota archaeon]|nr:hypothetical protein [Candidatus Woesearchaeota archaeon]